MNTEHYYLAVADWAIDGRGRHDVLALEHRAQATPPWCLVLSTTLGLSLAEVIDLAERHDNDCEQGEAATFRRKRESDAFMRGEQVIDPSPSPLSDKLINVVMVSPGTDHSTPAYACGRCKRNVYQVRSNHHPALQEWLHAGTHSVYCLLDDLAEEDSKGSLREEGH